MKFMEPLPDSRDHRAEGSKSETPREVRWLEPDRHQYDFSTYKKNTSERYNQPNLAVTDICILLFFRLL